MASLITHPVVPLVMAAIAGRKIIPLPLLTAGILFSMLPDLDGITFKMGIPYASAYGHRGFTHSIAMAFLCAAVFLPFAENFKANRLIVFLFLFGAMASHGLLDACTNQGLGVEFLWPFSQERFFFNFRHIEASPVSVSRFLSPRGIAVLRSEFVWVWAPLFILGLLGYLLRKFIAFRSDDEAILASTLLKAGARAKTR